ncbi:MAG: SIS domain-containing protein [Anaerolineae bacterium]|nr:SIS domain-containing protein [Anaerolineae bacterium]
MIISDDSLLTQARALIHAEGAAVANVAEYLDEQFVRAVHMVAGCSGRIYVTGAGTSGAMAKRLAHLLATCGMAAFHITPSDALHGEAALAAPGDVLIVFSKAGKSADINQFARICRDRGAGILCVTAEPESELAQLSHLVIELPVDKEGEGEGLLPFGSTLAHGAFGDALTLMAKRLRGFDLAQMQQTHPLGGAQELARNLKPAEE